MARTPLPPDQLLARFRAGASEGGKMSAQRRRERRRRYEAGELHGKELRDYEAWRARNKENGRLGGWPTHKGRHERDDDE